MQLPRITYAVILSGALAWCALILLAPYLAASSSPFSVVVYQIFHPICHQLPDRSFHLFGEKLAVCSRCSSIYFAFLLGVLAYPLMRQLGDTRMFHRNILLLAMLPMVIDVGLDMLGIHSSDYMTRAVTGGLFGLVVPFFILPASVEAVQQLAAGKPVPSQTTIIEQ